MEIKSKQAIRLPRHEKNGWDVLDGALQVVLTKLMSGRWITTVIICSAFAYLAMLGRIDQKDFVLVTMTIIGFYFGKGSEGDRRKLDKDKQ